MTSFSIRLNAMQLSQLPAFLNIHGRIHADCKDVYFLEWLGFPELPDSLAKTLSNACSRTANSSIVCMGAHMLPSPDQAARFASAAQALLAGSTNFSPARLSALLPPEQLRTGLHTALHEISGKLAVPAIGQNQAAELLSALDAMLPLLFPISSTVFPKCIWIGEPDTVARLFLSVLPYLGCDVAVLRPTGTQALFPQAVTLKGIPAPVGSAETLLCRLSPDVSTKPAAPSAPPVSSAPKVSTPAAPSASPAPASSGRQVLHIPQHPRRTSAPAPKTVPAMAVKPPIPAPAPSPAPSMSTERVPLDYETLAGFASSVVMIEVLDEHGNPKSSGSGVLLAPGGIILTNFHVVAGGSVYAVHLENNDAVFETDELLKYHPDFDLALLRLPGCNGKPIPVYQGADLARGQSVFAIGSPLGLFNSVSDGIIAGFRQFEHTKMIQFTAPAAPGSSGGALLDRYGFLIGIVTSGFLDGQNLNLAVSYEIIRQFARGFLPQ